MNNKFTFNNKQTYLVYRAKWKAEYSEISNAIREKRYLRVEFSRACNKAWTKTEAKWPQYYNDIRAILASNPRYVHLEAKYRNNGTMIEVLKKRATEMLAELREAKQESQRQYLAAKSELIMA